MRKFIRRAGACALALALCLVLCACGALGAMGGAKQEAADSSEEAAIHFLTNLQNGEYDMAKTYMKEGNELLHVLPGEGGESAIPELAEAYSQFCEKMKDLSFQVAEGESSSNSIVFFTARQYDFGSAINAAMLEALQTQCREGGTAFADYAAWMSKGIADAEMGEEQTAHTITSKTNGSYIIQHEGYGDVDFLNMITGGFYDYADLQMAVCTLTEDGEDFNYCVLALGDRVIAYLEQVTETDTAGEYDEVTLAGIQDYCDQTSELIPGMYMGCYKQGDKVTLSTGIDFETVDQSVLIDAGVVDGRFKGNTTTSYLSLAVTIQGFEAEGMTCVVTPVYEAEK